MVLVASLGPFVVSVVALLFAVWLLWQVASENGGRWRLWGAAISIDAAAIAFVSFLQINSSDPAVILVCERVRYTGVLLLVSFTAFFAADRLGRPSPVVLRGLSVVHAGLIVSTWVTPWVIVGEIQTRSFAFIRGPYYEAAPGPLGYASLAYVMAVAIVMVGVWIVSAYRSAPSDAPSVRIFLSGFGFWILVGLHDVLAKLSVFDGGSYLIEYGFLGFSVAVLGVSNREFSAVRKSLASSEARFKAILHASPHPMLVLDANGEVDYANAALSKLLECTKRELHAALDMLIPSKELARLKNRLEDEARRSEPLVFETTISSCSGEEIELEASGTWMGAAPTAVEGFVFILTDVRGRKRAEREMRRLAYQDGLTGLPNRTAFAEELDHMLENSRRQTDPEHWAVLFLDLDDFKHINDRFGHAAGDTILTRTASRIRSSIRRTDHCYRLGGDEFLVVVTHVTEDTDIAKVADKLVEQIRRPQKIGSDEMRVGVSIGITIYPHDGHDRGELLAHADIAMYAAKADGSDYRFFTNEMNVAALRRMEIEHTLPRATEQGDITLHYQPVVGPDDQLIGAESLARWRHPGYGWVSPAEFIPIAERTGAIRDLGYRVIESALTEAKSWEKRHGLSTRVGVNLSALQFEDETFPGRLTRMVHAHGIDPALVVLELTEGSVMRNTSGVITAMEKLQKAGFRFALDDFGSGYSALSYINRLPVDVLKIDRSFAMRAVSNSGDEKMLRTMVALAHDLGMLVVIEGVETAEQVNLVRTMGPVRMQGYFFAHPMPGEELPEWVSRSLGTSRPIS